MIKIIRQLYFTQRFFLGFALIIILFILSFSAVTLFYMSIGLLGIFVFAVFYEVILLFQKRGITAHREVAKRLSNGDENPIQIKIISHYNFPVSLTVIDEVPIQFQRRDIHWSIGVAANSNAMVSYYLRPVKRGSYEFGKINIFASTAIQLIERRYSEGETHKVPVYPSYLQLRKYELAAFSKNLSEFGIKKVRRIGSSMEFEQIKNYVPGDDPRKLNWKATARARSLRINQFQEEKSQSVYSLIDKGRLMQFPFDGMTLLDYAINASLVISNIAIKKGDKAGFISFSNKLSTVVPADKKPGYMSRILEGLYNQKTRFKESNFELLSAFVSRKITHRSLLLLYTNFESLSAMHRQLPYLRNMARSHVVVVIFFRNTGLSALLDDNPSDLQGIYEQTIAEHIDHEKELIIKELRRNGIYGLITKPENLTIDTINKYLEMKAKNF